ncbi:hypothetical protein MJK72_00850 [Klebsiella pneumoniae]|nr:hypothetical protein MJK72_00850 [Klebsiella pneumoniae]
MDERDKAANNAKDILHCRRFADDVGGWATYRRISRLLLLTDKVAYRPVDQGDGFIDIKRFGQIAVKRALLVAR